MNGNVSITHNKPVRLGKQIPRGEEQGVDPETGRPHYLARPGEPVDRVGRPLAPHMAPVFADGRITQSLIDRLDEILLSVNDLKCRRAGTYLDSKTIGEQIEYVRQQLSRAAPYCVCPSCGGSLRPGGGSGNACRTCGGADFISAGGFAELNADLQVIANGYGEPPFLPPRRRDAFED